MSTETKAEPKKIERIRAARIAFPPEDLRDPTDPKLLCEFVTQEGKSYTRPISRECWTHLKREEFWKTFDRHFLIYQEDGVVIRIDSFLYKNFDRGTLPSDWEAAKYLTFLRSFDDSLHLVSRTVKTQDRDVLTLIDALHKKGKSVKSGDMIGDGFLVVSCLSDHEGQKISIDPGKGRR